MINSSNENRTLRTAVIGAGMMGQHHVRVYATTENVDLVGVCDADEATLTRLRSVYAFQPYSDYRTLFDTERPDAISIAVPTKYHFEIAAEALKRGIHVMVEKPIASTEEQALELIELAEENNVCLTVGHIEQFNPAIVELQKRIADNELGRIFQINARRTSPFPRRISDVGVILDLATHDIVVMRYLLKSQPKRVFAETEQKAHQECEDLLSGLIRFENGVIGTLDVNWLTPSQVRQLTVLGERGMYVADYLTQEVFWYKNAHYVPTDVSTEWQHDVLEGDMVKIRLQKKEPLKVELDSFIESIRLGSQPVVTGQDGLEAVRIAQALIASGETNRQIDYQSFETANIQK